MIEKSVRNNKMKLISTYRYRHNLVGILLQVIPVILVFYVVPFELFQSSTFKYTMILTFILSRYPHEYIHQWIGKSIGINSEINFKKFNPTCTPDRDLNWKEVFIFSLAPFVILSSIYLLGGYIFIRQNNEFWHYIFASNLYLTFASCAADFGYAYTSIMNRNCIFRDTGATVEVYATETTIDN